MKLPVLGSDFSDNSHLTRTDPTFETTEVTISAKEENKTKNQNAKQILKQITNGETLKTYLQVG